MNSRVAVAAPDVVVGDRATDEQKSQRLIDISNWLDEYAAFAESIGGKVQFIEDAAKQINHLYWEILEERVRSRIKSATGEEVTVDRHKICSLTELVIVKIQPVDHVIPSKKTDLSARLAYFCALNILGCWDKEIVDELWVSDSFEREHLTWLRNLNKFSDDMPIFSNSATWYLIEKIFLEREQFKQELAEARLYGRKA